MNLFSEKTSLPTKHRTESSASDAERQPEGSDYARSHTIEEKMPIHQNTEQAKIVKRHRNNDITQQRRGDSKENQRELTEEKERGDSSQHKENQ